MCVYIYTHAHTHTRARTHTHTHTHAHARTWVQVALLLLRVREEEGPEPGPQSDSEDEAPLDTSPARSPAKAKSPSKRGEDGREVAVRDERDVLYAEGPEDRDDLVPDCGEGRGSQLLFSRFLAPGGSWSRPPLLHLACFLPPGRALSPSLVCTHLCA